MLNTRSISSYQYVILLVAVLITIGYYAVLLKIPSEWMVDGVELSYLLRASVMDLEIFYPNFGWAIYITSRSMLVGLPIFVSLAFILYNNFFKDELTIANASIFFSFIVVGVLVIEFALRMTGIVPGQLRYNKWVTLVDELNTIPGFKTDTNGIFVADTSVANKLWVEWSIGPKLRVDRSSIAGQKNKVVPELGIVFRDHLEHGDQFRSQSPREVDESLGEFDSILDHYVRSPINQQGFYSIPFDTMVGGRPRVLLLGDSFTWGHSTSNKTQSFSNLLLSRGWAVYNTGISGADVPQYKKVLETYLDQLHPHVVVLNFYMGNGVVYFDRKPLANVPLHFTTNAGNIQSFQDGEQFLDAASAYRNMLRYLAIPKSGLLGRWSHSSAIATRIWSVLYNLGFVGREMRFPEKPSDIPVCNGQIREMIEYCGKLNIPLIVSVIPNLNQKQIEGASTVKNLFVDISYSEPAMTSEMYNLDDGHFNDEGHLFYANYLHQLIKAELDEMPVRSDTALLN